MFSQLENWKVLSIELMPKSGKTGDKNRLNVTMELEEMQVEMDS